MFFSGFGPFWVWGVTWGLTCGSKSESILYNLNFKFVCVCVLFGCLEKLKEERGKRTDFFPKI